MSRVQPTPENEAEIYEMLGISYMSIGDNTNAKKYLKKALEIDNTNIDIKSLLELIE